MRKIHCAHKGPPHRDASFERLVRTGTFAQNERMQTLHPSTPQSAVTARGSSLTEAALHLSLSGGNKMNTDTEPHPWIGVQFGSDGIATVTTSSVVFSSPPETVCCSGSVCSQANSCATTSRWADHRPHADSLPDRARRRT